MSETLSPAQPWLTVDQPPGVRDLPVDARGVPMFYVIQAPPGRTFSFKVINPANQAECGLHRLCAICGRHLDYRFVFLGDLESYHDREFGFGPMHRACLDYARQVCPFLIGRYEPRHVAPTDPLVRRSTTHIAAHVDVQVIYETRGIRRWREPAPHDLLVFHPEAPTRLEFFDRDWQPITAPPAAPRVVGRIHR